MAKTVLPPDALPSMERQTEGQLVIPKLQDFYDGPAVRIHSPSAFEVTTRIPWHRRLWYMLTNPFTYLFTGKLRW